MADMTFFNSDRNGISHPATGKTSTWDNFYRGILPSPSSSGRPTTAQMQAIRAVPSDRGPASMTRAEMDAFNRQYGYFPGAAPNPAVTAINTAAPPAIGPGPGPLPRPGYAPTAIDMAAMNGMPPALPPALPPAAPAGGGQLAALLEAAQGLGGLLGGVLPGGGGSIAPAGLPSMTPQQQAASYNGQNKAGFNDWGVSGGGTVYSKGIMDKHLSQAGTGSASASKTAGGRNREGHSPSWRVNR